MHRMLIKREGYFLMIIMLFSCCLLLRISRASHYFTKCVPSLLYRKIILSQLLWETKTHSHHTTAPHDSRGRLIQCAHAQTLKCCRMCVVLMHSALRLLWVSDILSHLMLYCSDFLYVVTQLASVIKYSTLFKKHH